MAGVTEEVAKAAGGFMSTMASQPLALALVVMNFVLLGFLFYNGSSVNAARQATVDRIITQQSETDKLLANCVSGEVTRVMLDNMQKITETMLSAEQKEITRMQNALNDERQRSYQLREKEAAELEKLRKEQEGQSRVPQPGESKPQPQKFKPGERSLMNLPLPAIPDSSPAVLQYQQTIRRMP